MLWLSSLAVLIYCSVNLRHQLVAGWNAQFSEETVMDLKYLGGIDLTHEN